MIAGERQPDAARGLRADAVEVEGGLEADHASGDALRELDVLDVLVRFAIHVMIESPSGAADRSLSRQAEEVFAGKAGGDEVAWAEDTEAMGQIGGALEMRFRGVTFPSHLILSGVKT